MRLWPFKRKRKSPEIIRVESDGKGRVSVRFLIPAQASNEEIRKAVTEFVCALSTLHIAEGGSGLVLDDSVPKPVEVVTMKGIP